MQKITDYKIIIEMDTFKLEDKIKEMIEDGWMPLGTFSLRKGAVSGYEYVQAMVKYDS